tara:strand:+ start:7220 stop:7540 length:321 start_codon:yes stop_codon:yes gene_type:complete
MFDPSELTVKEARSKLSGLDLDDLEAVLVSEIDGKHRSSLIAEIGRAIDALKTEEEAAPKEAVVEVAAPVEAAPPKAVIPESQWIRYPRHVRRGYVIRPDGMFEEI